MTYFLKFNLILTHGEKYMGRIFSNGMALKLSCSLWNLNCAKRTIKTELSQKGNPKVKKVLGDGLAATTQAEKWAKLRKIANHAFHGESLKSMIPVMIASTETMLERWKNHEGEEIEVVEEFRLLTSEVISKTAFGSSYLEGQNIFEMLMKLYSLISRNFFEVRVPVIRISNGKSSDLNSRLPIP